MSKESTSTESSSTPSTGTESSARKPRIWEWGVDESLWNPDRSRYAGLLPLEIHKDEGDIDMKERLKRANEWIARCLDMTEDERKQEQRAVDAIREAQTPLDDDRILDELCDIDF